MKKEDKLCRYIEDLINHIYLCKPATKIAEGPYNQLIDGLKRIGFRFDFTQPVTLEDLDESKMVRV